jgi:hypothetical protein
VWLRDQLFDLTLFFTRPSRGRVDARRARNGAG